MRTPNGLDADERSARLDGALLAALVAAVRERGRPLGDTETKAIHIALSCARFLRRGGGSEARAVIDRMFDVLQGRDEKPTTVSDLAAAHHAVREAYARWRSAQHASAPIRDAVLAALREKLRAIDPTFDRLSIPTLRDAFARHERANASGGGATETLAAVLAIECGALGAGGHGPKKRMSVSGMRRAIEEAERTAA